MAELENVEFRLRDNAESGHLASLPYDTERPRRELSDHGTPVPDG